LPFPKSRSPIGIRLQASFTRITSRKDSNTRKKTRLTASCSLKAPVPALRNHPFTTRTSSSSTIGLLRNPPRASPFSDPASTLPPTETPFPSFSATASHPLDSRNTGPSPFRPSPTIYHPLSTRSRKKISFTPTSRSSKSRTTSTIPPFTTTCAARTPFT